MRRNELRMYLTAKRAEKKMDKMFLDAPWLPWGTTADHAVEQVRTNGCEDLSTLIDLVQEGEEYLGEMEVHEITMATCRATVQKVLDELQSYFEICPACNGAKGAFDKDPESRFWIGRGWEDCATCDGHGMLPRGESVWQDEGRTYTPPEQQLDTRIDGCTRRREAA